MPRGNAWLEVQSPHFELYTDLQEAAALDMSRALEESRASLVQLAWNRARDPRGRTQVAVFASEGRFHDYERDDDVAGIAQSLAGNERLIATYWDDDRPSGLPRVAVHEIAHDLSYWFAPLQPPWYSEGMASFLEGMQFDRATNRAILGEVPPPMLRVLKTPGRTAGSIQQLFDAPRAFHGTTWETSRFYFTSWLLVHYLMNHQEVFYQFQLDLAALRDWRDAWSERFPRLGPAALDAELERYLDGGQFNYMAEVVELQPFSPRLRTLSPAEGHGLSSWIAHRLGARQLSESEQSAALTLDPNEFNALRTRYHELDGRDARAQRRELARQLVRAHPDNGEAWLLLARAGDSADERADAIARARQSMPDHPGVLELLAENALDAKDSIAALEHTRLLIRRTVLSVRIAALHIQALASNAQCDEALQVARGVNATYTDGCNVSKGGQVTSCLQYFEKLIQTSCPAG